MDPLARFEHLIIGATRLARRFYRYLTGDQTCLGFVRLMCLIVVLFDAASVIAYVRNGSLRDAGAGLGGSAILLLLVGPNLFRAAASTDRSPIGPGAEAVKPDMMVVVDIGVTIALVGVFLYAVASAVFGGAPPTGDLLAQFSFPAFVLAIWGPRDRDGGKGDRTLTKDLRRLLHRAGPEIAGGHVTRRPVPAPVAPTGRGL